MAIKRGLLGWPFQITFMFLFPRALMHRLLFGTPFCPHFFSSASDLLAQMNQLAVDNQATNFLLSAVCVDH
jgi:hypothetical protein